MKKSRKKAAFRLSTKTNKPKKDAVVDLESESSSLDVVSESPRRSLRSNTPKESPSSVGRSNSDEVEECAIDGCQRTFAGYFSLMRHVALNHRQSKTAELLKLKTCTPPNTDAAAATVAPLEQTAA